MLKVKFATCDSNVFEIHIFFIFPRLIPRTFLEPFSSYFIFDEIHVLHRSFIFPNITMLFIHKFTNINVNI